METRKKILSVRKTVDRWEKIVKASLEVSRLSNKWKSFSFSLSD